MKLETLKDIEEFPVGDGLDFVFVNKLRDLAIKWVKEKDWGLNKDDFMEFLNITSEDLMVYKDNKQLNEKERAK